MLVVSRPRSCLAALMMNPGYKKRGASTWSENVRFGRVSNFDQCFSALLQARNLAANPKPHTELRFREFVVDADEYKAQLAEIVNDHYPVLHMTLATSDQSYSICASEKLYAFYAMRRLAKIDAAMNKYIVELSRDFAATNGISNVTKSGFW